MLQGRISKRDTCQLDAFLRGLSRTIRHQVVDKLTILNAASEQTCRIEDVRYWRDTLGRPSPRRRLVADNTAQRRRNSDGADRVAAKRRRDDSSRDCSSPATRGAACDMRVVVRI